MREKKARKERKGEKKHTRGHLMYAERPDNHVLVPVKKRIAGRQCENNKKYSFQIILFYFGTRKDGE